jgi:hypothetical protein
MKNEKIRIKKRKKVTFVRSEKNYGWKLLFVVSPTCYLKEVGNGWAPGV